jgi:hypothetical protein
MSTRGVFDNVVAHHLGLTDAPALVANPLGETQLGVSWLSCDADPVARKPEIPAQDCFVGIPPVTTALRRGVDLWRELRL